MALADCNVSRVSTNKMTPSIDGMGQCMGHGLGNKEVYAYAWMTNLNLGIHPKYKIDP